jgi:hypothetical protein
MLQKFGFGTKWRAWMRACVCAGNMSVLINGSPTGEISIKRGLKQGDPLAPLLFLLVAEGLGMLVRRAVEVNRFKPFLVGTEEFPVSILQYADDTLCIGEASVENLWTLKAILRGFEMMSGLKVNFFKSCLVGVNVSDEFMFMATEFLNCRRGSIPFKYLGLPVGGNPRKLDTWEPMLTIIKRKLGTWRNKYVSFGGRIVLLNAVLSAIPVFFLSYMKMPVKVWKELVKIQRDFLWRGLSKSSGIFWVKWDDICKPKKEGGLGIRDLRLVNVSLLAKWRWKLLSHENEVWKDVMIAKYGPGSIGVGDLRESRTSRLASKWWLDICTLDKDSNWFVEAVVKEVGNGNNTLFWKEVWIGNQPLFVQFPRIYGISNQKSNTILSLGSWVDGVWSWNFSWRRNLFEWEVPMFEEFLGLIQHFVPAAHEDKWVWRMNVEDGFSVRDCYDLLYRKFREHGGVDRCDGFAFEKIWKCGAPSKVCAFSWQAILGRIQTKENLCKRRVLQPNQTSCALCGVGVETTIHLILHCNFSSKVWYGVMRWLGYVIIPPLSLSSSFGSLVEYGRGKRGKKCLAIIWCSFLWAVWNSRNEKVFNNKDVGVVETIKQVKFQAWKWFIGRIAKSPCLLYEWNWSPVDCFMR